MGGLKSTAGTAAVVGTLALAGYASWLMVGGGEEPPAAASDAEVEAEAARRRDRLGALARGMQRSHAPSPDDADEDASPPNLQPGEITADEARQGFDYAMRKVESLGRKRRRLDQAQWDETWRTANDAYAALSMYLDVSDRAQAAELEEAYRRLQEGLRRVRVRGGKFTY